MLNDYGDGSSVSILKVVYIFLQKPYNEKEINELPELHNKLFNGLEFLLCLELLLKAN